MKIRTVIFISLIVWLFVAASCSSKRSTAPKNTRRSETAEKSRSDAVLPPSPSGASESSDVSAGNSDTGPAAAAAQKPVAYFRELKAILASEGFEIFKNDPLILGVNHRDIFKTLIMYMEKDNVLWLVSLFAVKQGHKCGDRDLEEKLDIINSKYNMKEVAGYPVFAVACIPRSNAVAARMIIPFTPKVRSKKKDMPQLLQNFSSYIYKTFDDAGLKPFLD